MNRTSLALALIAQLAAGSALAQTNTTTNQPEGSGSGSTYGTDWSSSLGAAMFGEDGTTMRSVTEIATQWNTLSQDDKDMIRRDCMAYMQATGTAAGSTGTAGTTTTTTGTGTAATGTGTASTGTDTTTTTGTGTGTASTGTASTGTASTGADTGSTLSVSMEQMEQICAATKDL
jgi:hypothetical protein